ncbi:DUF433 domain-containing protein [Candidatus Daviesbacteria bacterium]|nr:DUF433 domain-containing protein [Candidatus Daviesbacteria bacterium]
MRKPQIISDPKILGGKPIVAGTRISVELILDRMSAGMSEKEILADYPHLAPEQIHAAVAYAKKLVAQKSRPASEDISPITLYTHEISR